MADIKISALTSATTPLAGTEVLPIVQSSTTKQVSVANLTAGRSISALSVAFPATQSASSDANTLDDYEEGTWTPVIGGTNSATGQTYSTQSGTYTKIGRQVTITFQATLTALGTISGQQVLTGLPFLIPASGTSSGTLAWSYGGLSSVYDVQLYGRPGFGQLYIFKKTNDTTPTYTLDTNNTGLTDTTSISATLTYYVA